MDISILFNELWDEFLDLVEQSRTAVSREQQLPMIQKKIHTIIGMRRTGKTYFMLQRIHELLVEGVPLTQILYVNFEDDRLLPLSHEKLVAVIDAFYAKFPENHQQTCHLLLDEIQNVSDWALVIRRFFDKKKVKIYLGGSSSKLLSKEISTSLRGRSIATEIWPYSFTEYLSAKEVSIPPHFSKKYYDQLLQHLKHYLMEGGFPEVFGASLPDRIRVLQEYVNVVIFRDIIERHNVRYSSVIRAMIANLLKNVGTAFSTNKLYQTLKTQGFSTSKDTLYEYLDHIEDAYLVFCVPLFSESIRQQQTNPKKTYAIDTGLARAEVMSLSDNIGHAFENLVYLDLRRQGKTVYYYLTESRYEIDFVAKAIDGSMELIQVTWETDEQSDVFLREKRALEAAQQELGIPGRIITPITYCQAVCERKKSCPLKNP